MRRVFPSLAAVVAALALVSCGSKPDPAGAAKKFFDQIKAGQTEAAFQSGAFGFQAQQSLRFFDSSVKEMRLAEAEKIEIQPAEMEPDGRTARVQADFFNAAGEKKSLVVTLVQEGGEWKVFAVKTPRSLTTGLVENRFSIVGRNPEGVEAVNRQEAPDVAEANELILTTLMRFNDAVKQADFGEFFSECSLTWQDQLVTEKVTSGIPMAARRALTESQKELGASRLQRAFQPFIEGKIDISNIKTVEPVLDTPPRVTTDGLLILSGYYPTEPYKTAFTLKFMYELPKWRLFGLDVSLRK